MWTGLIWLRTGQVARCCEHGNGSSCVIKFREFLDYMRKYKLLNEDSASWNSLVS